MFAILIKSAISLIRQKSRNIAGALPTLPEGAVVTEVVLLECNDPIG